MMTCAILGADGTSCVGSIRDPVNSINSAAYRWNQDPSRAICQPNARGVSNLARYYPNGMGALSAGSTFKVQWMARNHAVNNQNPRVVKVYMSPAITSGQTADFTSDQMMQNKICEGPFINCGKGAGVDTTGDQVPCTLSCTVPANTPQGTYTLWWQWDWTVNDGAIYATCADVTVSSSIVAPPNNPATSARTSNAASTVRTSAARTTAARTSAAIQNNAATSAEAEQDTVDQPEESKIAAGDCGDPAMCVTACGGQELVGQCTCNNGQFLIHCTSSSFAVVPLLAAILGVVMILL